MVQKPPEEGFYTPHLRKGRGTPPPLAPHWPPRGGTPSGMHWGGGFPFEVGQQAVQFPVGAKLQVPPQNKHEDRGITMTSVCVCVGSYVRAYGSSSFGLENGMCF